MDNINQHSSIKEKLLLAGLEELNNKGIHNFSTRNVAKKCGVSCAAPYKHFKDTHDFISNILGYVNQIYSEEQKIIMEKYSEFDSRSQLIQISLHYIRFLVEHPEFRRVIMQNFSDCDEKYRTLKGKLSIETDWIVSKYCKDVNMPKDVRIRKTFIVRSIIYCAALFFDNGEMEYNEENMNMVAAMLEREFNLPYFKLKHLKFSCFMKFSRCKCID